MRFVLGSAVLVFGIAGSNGGDDRPLESLAQMTLKRGRDSRFLPAQARYFGLPSGTEDLIFKEIAVELEEGGIKRVHDISNASSKPQGSEIRAIQVRRRTGSDRIDIFLVHKLNKPPVVGSYFFQTSPSGKLEKAIFLNKTGPQSFPDAKKLFEIEKAFWLDWTEKQKK